MPLWTPSRITTALWLDAGDSSTLFDATSGGSLVAADGAVARWEDKSGNARHVTQGTLANRPLRKVAAQNGLDALLFDGSNDLLVGASTSIAKNSTQAAVFGVFRYVTNPVVPAVAIVTNTNLGNARVAIGSGVVSQTLYFQSRRLDADAGNIVSDTATQGTTFFLAYGVIDYANTSAFLYRNGTLRVSSSSHGTAGSTSNTDGAFGIGGSTGGSNLANINACECGFINDISQDTRQRLEGYLAHRWGLQSSLPNDHPYKNAAPSYGGSSPINGQSLIRSAGSAQQQLLIQGATT
jgi:hypothetical protein